MGEKGNALGDIAGAADAVGSTSVVTSVVSTVHDTVGGAAETFTTKLQDRVAGAAVDATVDEAKKRIVRERPAPADGDDPARDG